MARTRIRNIMERLKISSTDCLSCFQTSSCVCEPLKNSHTRRMRGGPSWPESGFRGTGPKWCVAKLAFVYGQVENVIYASENCVRLAVAIVGLSPDGTLDKGRL
jgi:hypothetical protein